MKRNKIIAFTLASALTFGVAIPTSFAAPSQSEVNEAKSKITKLSSELDTMQSQLAKDTEKMENIQFDIDKKQSDIDKLGKELDQSRDTLSRRMRINYKMGHENFFTIILGSTDFNDLVNRIYIMDKVSSQDEKSIQKVTDLENKMQTEMSELKQKEEAQKSQLQATQAKVATYDAKVKEAREYYNKLDKELKAEIERKAKAEEERRRREQEEAHNNQQPSDTGGGSISDIVKPKPKPKPKPNVPSGGGLATVYAQLGKPYVWGATGPNSFDCSGLVCYAYGYKHGRTTYSMIASLKASGRWKSVDQLQPGDLIFPHSGHVGVYIGNGQMIHASTPATGVIQTSIWYRGSVLGGGTY